MNLPPFRVMNDMPNNKIFKKMAFNVQHFRIAYNNNFVNVFAQKTNKNNKKRRKAFPMAGMLAGGIRQARLEAFRQIILKEQYIRYHR